MSLEYSLNNVSSVEKEFEGSCEQAVDCEINLPDYCADILRVLKCTVTPSVVSSKISGDRASCDGNIFIRIVYCDEDENICSAEHTVPFSKYVETGADMTGALTVSAKSEYVNCRALSRRKAEIHGTVRFIFAVSKVNQTDFISSIESDGVQTKGAPLPFSTVTACDVKQFPINETAEIPADYLPCGKILNTSAVPIMNEAKIIKGKLLLKGEVSVNILYCADKNKGECQSFDYTIPVNQVIDCQGISDESFADVRFTVMSCDIAPREDSEGEQRLFDINLAACAEITAYINKESDYISDAYATTGKLNAKYQSVDFYKHSKTVSDTFNVNSTFDFTSVSSQKVLAVWFGEPEIKLNSDNGAVSGKIPVSFILSDEDGKPVFCERELDFEYNAKGGQFLSKPCVSLSRYALSSSAAGKADIKSELVISGSTFTKENVKAMISAELEDEKSDTAGGAGVVIYFPDGNEKLWDIARKYGTTEQAIRKENGLNGDCAPEGAALIVPCS